MFKMAKHHEMAVLAKQFQSLVDAGDDHQTRMLLSRVLSHVSQGEDCGTLLPSVVKLLAHRDLCVKRLAGEVLVHCSGAGSSVRNSSSSSSSSNRDIVLLAINSLVQDCGESSPLLRDAALKTLSSLRAEDSVVEHLQSVLGAALADRSAHVRRGAVFACVRLHHMLLLPPHHHDSSLKDSNLIDTLYGMIRDPDPTVVSNCLVALEEVLRDEGGVVVNRAIAHYLLRKLDDFPTWSLVQVLGALRKYVPADRKEASDIMNVMDGHLDSNSSTVVLSCVELFLHLQRDRPDVQSQVFRRARPSLVSHLTRNDVEVSYCIIDALSKHAELALPHFCRSFQSFFCRNREPLYLKAKKISLLPKLITEENGKAIVEELSLYCVNTCEEVSFHAVRAIRIAHQQKPYVSKACEATFVSLMRTSSLPVLSSLFQTLQTVQVDDRRFWERLVPPITQHFRSFTDSRAKAAALYLIGQRLRDSEEALAVVESCVEEFGDLDDRRVKEQLLTTTAKMFLCRPCELQSMLGGLLEAGVRDSEREVRMRAQYLYGLLKGGLDTASTVLLGISPPLATDKKERMSAAESP